MDKINEILRNLYPGRIGFPSSLHPGTNTDLLVRHGYSSYEKGLFLPEEGWTKGDEFYFKVLTRNAFWKEPDEEGIILESLGYTRGDDKPIGKIYPFYLVGENTVAEISAILPYDDQSNRMIELSGESHIIFNNRSYEYVVKIIDSRLLFRGLRERIE